MMTMPSRLAAVAALLLSAGVASAAPPAVFTYSGFLVDAAGSPVSGVHDFTFQFHSASTGGTQLGTDVLVASVPVADDGYFTAVVNVAGFPAAFTGRAYMAVKLDAEAFMTPRIELTSVPAALSVPFAGITGWPTTPCSDGQFAVGFDVNGNLVCAAATSTTGGDLTEVAVAAGGGLAVTSGTGPVPSVGLIRSCASGQVLKWNGSAWACANDADTAGGGTVTNVLAAAGGGLTVANGTTTPSVGLVTSCASGQLLKWNGSAWACGPDEGGASYGATLPLALSGSAFGMSSSSCPTGGVWRWNGFLWECVLGSYGVEPSGGLTIDASNRIGVASGSCVSGQVLKYHGAGGWYCDADAGGTAYVAGQAIAIDGSSISLGTTGCTEGELWKFVSGAWSCVADANSGGTITGVTTNSGLTGGGTAGSVTLGIAPAGVGATQLADGAVTFAKWAANGCATNQIPKWSGTAWTCAADAAGTGTVTNVTAAGGTPITIANGTTTPQLSMTPASSSASGYLSSGDWTTFNAKQPLLSSACAAGQFVSGFGAGVMSCATPPSSGGTVTSVTNTSGGGITVGGTAAAPTVGLQSCAAGYVLKSTGTGWSCQADANSGGSVTSIAAGGGLSGGTITTSGTISLDTTAPNGWTGAQSVSVAAGTALSGMTSATAGGAHGVYGSTASASGYGGQFQNHATAGTALSASAPYIGVVAEATSTNTNSSAYGIVAFANDNWGIGGYFSAPYQGITARSTATSGAAYGVYGSSDSAIGYGGYFRNSVAGGTALYALGEAVVTGTVTAASVELSTARTRYVSIPANDFSPWNSSTTYGAGFIAHRYATAGGATAYFIAGLHLPDGVELTNVTCAVLDNHATYSITVGVSGTSNSGGDAGVGCTSQTSSGQNTATQTLNIPCSTVIDNSAYAYKVYFRPSDSACGSACALYKCTARYTEASL